MKYLFWVGITFFVFIIQGSVSLFDVTPNFTILIACFAGIRGGEGKGLLLGSLIGIFEDSLSGTLLGPHMLSKGLMGYLAGFLSSKFFVWTPVLGILSGVIITMADGVAVFTVRSVFAAMPCGIGAAAFIIMMQSLLNAPLGLLLKKRTE